MEILEQLGQLIEWKRIEMIEIAHETGLSSSKTLQKSIELDLLLNQHHQLSSKKYAHEMECLSGC